MANYEYDSNNFIFLPESSDDRIFIYDKNNNVKYSIDPYLSYYYVSNSCVVIKKINDNDIILTFKSNDDAIIAMNKLIYIKDLFEQEFIHIKCTLLDNHTSFLFETNQDFSVIQLQETNYKKGNDVNVINVNDNGPLYIKIPVNKSSDTYFKFKSDDIKDIELLNLSIITSLDESFNELENLENFYCEKNVTYNIKSMNSTWKDCKSLTTFPLIDTTNVTSMNNTWDGCSSLISFPLIDTSNVRYMSYTWSGCINISTFPQINTSNVIDISYTWNGCMSFSSFPQIDTSNVLTFEGTWMSCTSLVNFPSIDTSNVINLTSAWENCYNLYCISGTIDLSSLNNGDNTFRDCTNLLQPPPSGTTIRDNDNALPGIWTNPNTCP
jgi:hypothetical protein